MESFSSKKIKKAIWSFSLHTLHSSRVLFLLGLFSPPCSTSLNPASLLGYSLNVGLPQFSRAPAWVNQLEENCCSCFSQFPSARISAHVLKAEHLLVRTLVCIQVLSPVPEARSGIKSYHYATTII